MIGRRKNGKINHLCNILKSKNIKFDIEEIRELSVGQITKKIEMITGKKRVSRQRAGDMFDYKNKT